MTLCAAICDDSPADRLAVETMLSAWAQVRAVDVQIDCFPSAEQFLFHYADFPQYDLLLLDVEMSAMDGVTMAKEVRKTNETVEIVFITGYTDYIAEGYDVGALHYLVKPLHREKFFAVLDKALSRRAKNARCLTLDCGGTLVRVSLPEIRYLDVQHNYVTVHASKDYTVKRTLKDIAAELDGRFFQVGRSLIVNLHCIRRVTKQEIVLADGTALPLPRGAYEPLNRAIIQEG